MKRAEYERSVFLSDAHIPFQSWTAVKIALNFIRWFKPHFVFLVGDVMDWYQLSKFDKNPNRLLKIQDDLNDTQDFLYKVREAAGPKAEIIYFEGNHEFRLTKYLWQHPEIAALENLSMTHLLNLGPLKIKWLEQTRNYEYHGFQIEHGSIARKHSGYTARGQMEMRGTSGLSGHSHRLGTHYMTNMGGDYIWIENGCLCDRNPEYVKAPNWQNGFSVGWFKKNNHRFTIDQVIIVKGKGVYAGKEFLP